MKPKKTFSKTKVLLALGAAIFLFGALLLLSPFTHVRYVAFPVHYLVGDVGLWIIGFLLLFSGAHLMLSKWWRKFRLNEIVALVFFSLGLWFLLSCALGGEVYASLDASAFQEKLSAAYASGGQALYFDAHLLGGTFGTALLFGIYPVWRYLPYVISGLLLAVGIVSFFLPMLRKGEGKPRKENARNLRREEQSLIRQEEEGEYAIEANDPLPFQPQTLATEATFPSSPELSFSSASEETVDSPSGMDGYVFAPAGGSTLPSRKQLRAERAEKAIKITGDPTPEMSPYAPKEIISPTPMSYAQNPIKSTGLQEAVFCPAAPTEAQMQTQSAPAQAAQPKPAPAASAQPQQRPTTTFQQMQQKPAEPASKPEEKPLAPKFEPKPQPALAETKPEPEPAIEEKPASFAPSFLDKKPAPATKPMPTAPIKPILPAEEPAEEEEVAAPIPTKPIAKPLPTAPLHVEPEMTPVTAIDEDEEDPYVPPSNDPIVIAPKSAGILTPETMAPEAPKPQPASASIPDYDIPEEPKEEDDTEGPLPDYIFPGPELLSDGPGGTDIARMQEEAEQKSHLIDQIFADFGVGAHVTDFLIGPSITRYSIAADPGVSIASIARYIPDLEVRMGGVAVRFVERVLGQACSALEVPNESRRVVPFKEVFVGLPPRKETADLRIPFGLDIAGALKEADLAKFPHMLVAGTSGSGKSIFAHGILMSLIMRNRPENLKLVLIDPKRGVEMAPYKDMPHLLCPIVKEAKPARNCLKKLCDLMDERYKKFEEKEVRDIKDYNAEYALPNGKKRMPYIVVFVDEFADLVGECKEISEYVLRIAQKARACGIHLIVATQRPDVKVITGTIKSNLLCRVALTVASATDSQTILGMSGAEELYGYGDMLIDCQELSKRDFVRAQGCLTTIKEMKNVCDFVRKQLPANYDPDFLNLEDDEDGDSSSGPEIRDGGYAPIAAPQLSSQEMRKISDEEKYQYVKSVIMTRDYCSISMIQREFEVGFPRAGKILNRLQQEGIVATPGDTPNNSKGCRVLVHEDPGINGGGA